MWANATWDIVEFTLLMGGPGGLGPSVPKPPGGGVAGVEPPQRGVPKAVGCRQGGDFPPPE
jgi:hypothetical protein